MRTEAVQVPAAGATLTGHLAVPDGDGRHAGVVVLHEAYGLNDDIRGHANRLADHGYLALAPNLYSWGSRLRCVLAAMRTMTTGRGAPLPHIDGARQWLAGRPDCTGAVGVVGFCMGGGFAIALAASGFAVAAPNYGRVPSEADRVLAGSCPMVASFGGRDRLTKGHPERLVRALELNAVPHDCKVYDGVSHSFMNHHSGVPALLDKVMRTRFRPQAADDAWDRIIAFFGRHCG